MEMNSVKKSKEKVKPLPCRRMIRAFQEIFSPAVQFMDSEKDVGNLQKVISGTRRYPLVPCGTLKATTPVLSGEFLYHVKNYSNPLFICDSTLVLFSWRF